jgi:hypothetical protein
MRLWPRASLDEVSDETDGQEADEQGREPSAKVRDDGALAASKSLHCNSGHIRGRLLAA